MSVLINQRVALRFEPDKAGTVVAVGLIGEPDAADRAASAEFYLLVQDDSGRLYTWLAGNCEVKPYPSSGSYALGSRL